MWDEEDHVTHDADEIEPNKNPAEVILVLVIKTEISEYDEEDKSWWDNEFVYVFDSVE